MDCIHRAKLKSGPHCIDWPCSISMEHDCTYITSSNFMRDLLENEKDLETRAKLSLWCLMRKSQEKLLTSSVMVWQLAQIGFPPNVINIEVTW